MKMYSKSLFCVSAIYLVKFTESAGTRPRGGDEKKLEALGAEDKGWKTAASTSSRG